jgi:putative peptide zinc metalloprotease protein
MRADLVIVPQQFGSTRYWAIKDPVALKYFHVRDEEFALLQMLDGAASLEEIRQQFERQFAPLLLDPLRLQAFLSRMHRDGLLIADAPGQDEQLLERRRRRQRRTWAWSWARLLAIRFRGVDPDRFLDWLYPFCRPLLSPLALGLYVVAMLAAVLLVAVQFDAIEARLPTFEAFFRSDNLIWFMIALAGVKVLHELGHALVCKHFGGECHEIGVMLLVFTPCLYCNVSDSWLLPNRWRRIAIAGAGMGVELVIATLCVFLWWFSQPGLLNTLALSTMTICSVNTVLLNGNPLLRYDGYYILSDLVEMPNLAQRASSVVNRAFARICLGVDVPSDRALAERRKWPLALYAVLAIAYRLLVLVLILWFMYEVLKPHGLQSLAVLVGCVAMAGVLAVPVAGAARMMRDPVRRRQVRRPRVVLTLLLIALAIAGICLIPLPRNVTAPAVIEPADATRVYVSVPGVLQSAVVEGAQVDAAAELAVLENLELDAKIVELTGQRKQQELHLANLRLRRGGDAEAESQIPTARAALADLDEQLAAREAERRKLTLHAPMAGTVLPPPATPAPSDTRGRLPGWSGTPLNPRNRGCYLEAGVLVCLLGDPNRLEAVLMIDQADAPRVKVGDEVQIVLDQWAGEKLTGVIKEIAALDLKLLPRELAGSGAVVTQPDAAGVERPVDTLYRARVELTGAPPRMTIGAQGTAKIAAGSETIGARIAEYLQRTFRFEL